MKNPEIFAPKKFAEFIGQKQAKKVAEVIVSAARIEKRNPPNILIDGEYGLGKTTLAKIILNELGHPYRLYDAQTINAEIPFTKTPIIIDEIHNLTAPTADSLNIEIDEGRITIIGCTTNPGLMPMALKSRFRTIHLERYTESDLTTILDFYCLKRGMKVSRKLLDEISKRSRFNARIAVGFLFFMFDLIVTKGESTISSHTIEDAFKLLGVDDKGFGIRDYEYLLALPNDGRAVGIQYLAARLGMDTETITQEIEPYLMQMGYIDRTSRGRVRIK